MLRMVQFVGLLDILEMNWNRWDDIFSFLVLAIAAISSFFYIFYDQQVISTCAEDLLFELLIELLFELLIIIWIIFLSESWMEAFWMSWC